jgi:GT2 family glycosyltransferase
MTATVSIVIPTLNGAATLPALLDGIDRQHLAFPVEVVAIDSGSTDGTVELLGRRGVEVIRIPAEQFNHGATRNAGIARSHGELIVLTVQDALPATADWLAALTAPLISHARVAGAFARQRPRADASRLTQWAVERWAGSSPVARTSELAHSEELESLEPIARLERCTFDNVCSCIRRSVWDRFPFQPTPIAEDLEWARTVLRAGYQLAYVPDAVVIHSHERSASYEFARTYLLHRRLYELFTVRTIPTLPHLARAVASTVATHLRRERSARSLALAFAWPVGQYLGAWTAVRGWKALRVGRV